MDEFDRVADSSEFNGVKLLRNATPQTIQFMAGITGADTSLLQVTAANSHRYAGVVRQITDLNNDSVTNVFDLGAWSTLFVNSGSGTPMIEGRSFQNFAKINFIDSSGKTGVLDLLFDRVSADFNKTVPHGIVDPPATLGVDAVARSSDGEIVQVSVLGIAGSNPTTVSSSAKSFTLSFTFPVGGGSTSVSIDLSDIKYESRESGANVRETNIGFTNITSTYFAKNSLDTVKNRIDDLSSLEGQYGAVESRLNVAHNLLATSGENFAAASSRIKDADIANEAATSVRSGILQQAATSLLAQANQAPRIALSLLSGI